MTLLFVALGGALGACSRYGVGMIAQQWTATSFPLGTLLINVLGSFGMGLASPLLLSSGVGRAFVTIGFLGGFTTFSTFSFEFFSLIEARNFSAAGVYLTGSFLLSIGGLVLGILLGRWFSYG